MKERFDLLLKTLKINAATLAKEIKVSRPAITRIIKGEVEPSSKILVPIGEKLGVNIDWLLFGRGNMFVDNHTNTTQKIINGDGNNVQVGHGNESNMNNQNSEINHIKEIERLKSTIELLNKNLADKEKIIKLLEK